MKKTLLGYIGKRQSPFGEWYLLGNGYRGFHPVVKRFSAWDSASPFSSGGSNGYIYCNGNTINQSDPSGHGPLFWELGCMVAELLFDTEAGTESVASVEDVIGEVFEQRASLKPLKSHTDLYQEPASEELIYSLELSTSESGYHQMKNFATGELEKPDGTYLFVNRVDEPGIIRAARLKTIDGHTSLAQLPQAREYKPIDAYFAGEMVFEKGKLTKWTNGSGHYTPAQQLHSTNFIPWTKRILPDDLFKNSFVRYESI
ncbi:RHS repeat-associated core domain-containing protein [Rahnella aquatilis]|uniref:RHS repeat-associated core domain-containing protein n=1 Tax=Rahnella aquatilis TaxID=34038 RepID=UPI00068F2CCE|nr:RHS repeat-associated core domain-containing protein [Rahnella aquatilis]